MVNIRMSIIQQTLFSGVVALILFPACSMEKRLAGAARKNVISAASLKSAHVGISIFDPVAGKFLYNYQGDKYFVPASNTKIPTCYVAMKHLGDSLVGIRYSVSDTAIFLYPTGDPTLLHADYQKQPVIEWLRGIKKPLYISQDQWQEKALGYGWSWDDYNSAYMAERSPLPVYGNVIKWIQTETWQSEDGINGEMVSTVFSEPAVDWEMTFSLENKDSLFSVSRARDSNNFTVFEGKETYTEDEIPFITNGLNSALTLLPDTIGTVITLHGGAPVRLTNLSAIRSRHTDSLLKPMMHRSDNFFAEQSLLMVSENLLGVMNDRKVIDTLLKTDLLDLPQQPRWVDGSGLSRYNLFTPQDMVFILGKIQREFGMERVRTIFPTGGEGTLSGYYLSDSGYIYAKTGTLSGVVAISGYLTSKKGRPLIFSVLVNNHQSSAAVVRRTIEQFLKEIRNSW